MSLPLQHARPVALLRRVVGLLRGRIQNVFQRLDGFRRLALIGKQAHFVTADLNVVRIELAQRQPIGKSTACSSEPLKLHLNIT